MISLTKISNLSFKEPNKDLPASLIPPLNFIFSFLMTVPIPSSETVKSVSSFKVSNVKKSENGEVLNFFASLSGITLSRVKFSLTKLPKVLWLPTKLSLKVSAPEAAWLGTILLTTAITL